MQKNPLFVLSLGGSLIVPEEIDTHFLINFKKLILEQTKKGTRFVIITGGGMVCRKYQTALKKVAKPTNIELDNLGIEATRFNAYLIKQMFGKLAHPKLAEDPGQKYSFQEKILIGAGWEPGWSSDYDAVMLAKTYGAKTVINLSNINYLFNKDPKKFKDAKKIPTINWQGLFKIIGNKWLPGANLPFDPMAGKLAEKNQIKVIIANGKNLKNLKNILENKKFIGTEIHK
jgi:uridylate kinase